MDYTLKLEYEQVSTLVRENLIESLDMTDAVAEPKLFEALNHVIAYYSVPGTWMGGLYDNYEDDNWVKVPEYNEISENFELSPVDKAFIMQR